MKSSKHDTWILDNHKDKTIYELCQATGVKEPGMRNILSRLKVSAKKKEKKQVPPKDEDKLTPDEKSEYILWMHEHKTAAEIAVKIKSTPEMVRTMAWKLGVKCKKPEKQTTAKPSDPRTLEERTQSRKESEVIAIAFLRHYGLIR